MNLPAEIAEMPAVERLKALELIWDSLVRDASVIESPAWHGEIVQERLAKFRGGNAKLLSIEEVRRRLDAAR